MSGILGCFSMIPSCFRWLSMDDDRAEIRIILAERALDLLCLSMHLTERRVCSKRCMQHQIKFGRSPRFAGAISFRVGLNRLRALWVHFVSAIASCNAIGDVADVCCHFWIFLSTILERDDS